MTLDYIIKPGIGMGPLKFGMYRNQVQDILGVPDEIEQNNDEGDEIDVTWYYDNLDLVLYFDEEDDYRLSNIEIDNQEVILFGSKLSSINLAQATQLLSENGIRDSAQEPLEEETVLTSEQSGIDIYFEEGHFNSVQISPLFQDEDTVNWPD